MSTPEELTVGQEIVLVLGEALDLVGVGVVVAPGATRLYAEIEGIGGYEFDAQTGRQLGDDSRRIMTRVQFDAVKSIKSETAEAGR